MATQQTDISQQILRQLSKTRWYLYRVVRGIPYAALSRFCYDLGTCVRTGVDMPRAVELTVRTMKGTAIGKAWRNAHLTVRNGDSLTKAFAPAHHVLPPFFLPVVRAGERSGRLDEAFAFLEEHCKLLAGPTSAVRNLWLIPAVIMMAGTILKIALVAFLSPGDAVETAVIELLGWLKLITVLVILLVTPLRMLIDRIWLLIPWVGKMSRELAVHRFCRVLSLVYAVGEHRVEDMIEMAADAVDNWAARIDLMTAAGMVREGHTIGEAFQIVNTLTVEEKSAIDAGEFAGTLEASLQHIADQTGESLVFRAGVIHPVLTRLVMAGTMMAILATLAKILFR